MNEIQKSSPQTLSALLSSQSIKERFNDILKDKAPAFISSILSVVNSNAALRDCDPKSIIGAAAIAASLDLPINSSLGFAHLVPYSGVAQFQLGAKGFVQLALRSGQYKSINYAEIYDGEFISWDRLRGEIVLDFKAKKSDVIVGYVANFTLLNGFEKTFYMSKEEITAHAKKYSKSFSNPKAQWQSNFNAMALKTVLKLLLSKWGILSTQMQTAVEHDQSAIDDTSEGPNYIDSTSYQDPIKMPTELEPEIQFPDGPKELTK